MPDLAQLNLVVQSTQVSEGTKRLDDLSRAGDQAEASADRLREGHEKLEEGFRKVVEIVGELTGLYGLYKTVVTSLETATSVEKTGAAFATLLHSASQAKDMVQALEATALETGTSFEVFGEAAKKMLAVGINAKEVAPILSTVSKAVLTLGGGAAEIDAVSTSLSRMTASGKITSRDMMSLVESNIDAYGILAKAIGVDVSKAVQLVGSDMVNGKVAAQALVEGMKKFGDQVPSEFSNAALAVGQFRESIIQALGEVGVAFLRGFNVDSKLQSLVPFVQNLGKVSADFVRVFFGLDAEFVKDDAALKALAETLKIVLEVTAAILALKIAAFLAQTVLSVGGLKNILLNTLLPALGLVTSSLLLLASIEFGTYLATQFKTVYEAIANVHVALAKFKEELSGASSTPSNSQYLAQIANVRNQIAVEQAKTDAGLGTTVKGHDTTGFVDTLKGTFFGTPGMGEITNDHPLLGDLQAQLRSLESSYLTSPQRGNNPSNSEALRAQYDKDIAQTFGPGTQHAPDFTSYLKDQIASIQGAMKGLFQIPTIDLPGGKGVATTRPTTQPSTTQPTGPTASTLVTGNPNVRDQIGQSLTDMQNEIKLTQDLGNAHDQALAKQKMVAEATQAYGLVTSQTNDEVQKFMDGVNKLGSAQDKVNAVTTFYLDLLHKLNLAQVNYNIDQQITQMKQQTDLLQTNGDEREKLALNQKIMNDAAKAGITNYSELSVKIGEADTALKKLQDASKLSQMATDVGNAFSDTFDGIVLGAQNAQDALKGLLAAIEKTVFQQTFSKPIGQLVANALTGIGGSLTGGGDTSGSVGNGRLIDVASALGNAFYGGNLVPFALGGVVSSPFMFGMSGGRTGLMGEAGPEAVMPLTRLSNGRLGVQTEGANGSVTQKTYHQTFNIQTPNADSFRRSQRQVMSVVQRASREDS